MGKTIKLLIIGGCFPVQDNIESDKLYHQLLKDKFKHLDSINLDIIITRYESITKSFTNLKEQIFLEKPDCVLFHLRTEPLLYSAKLFARYHDKAGNFIKLLNIACLDYEKRIIKIPGSKNPIKPEPVKNSALKKIGQILRELNYFAGYIAGNWGKCFLKYLVLTNKMIELCKSGRINLVIAGPASRPYSFFENYISKLLHQFMSKNLLQQDQYYISLYGKRDVCNNFIFCEDLKRVNEFGHHKTAEILYSKLSRIKW